MFDRIVVGVNMVETAAEAARQALALGALTGAEVHLVCALPPEGARLSKIVSEAAPSGGGSAAGRSEDEARRHATNFVDRLRRGAKVKTRTHVLQGEPADVILQVAAEVNADLVVVGSKGMHGARRVLGSVPNTISHQADCAVLIVRTT